MYTCPQCGERGSSPGPCSRCKSRAESLERELRDRARRTEENTKQAARDSERAANAASAQYWAQEAFIHREESRRAAAANARSDLADLESQLDDLEGGLASNGLEADLDEVVAIASAAKRYTRGDTGSEMEAGRLASRGNRFLRKTEASDPARFEKWRLTAQGEALRCLDAFLNAARALIESLRDRPLTGQTDPRKEFEGQLKQVRALRFEAEERVILIADRASELDEVEGQLHAALEARLAAARARAARQSTVTSAVGCLLCVSVPAVLVAVPVLIVPWVRIKESVTAPTEHVVPRAVSFSAGCNLRSEPRADADIVAWLSPKTQYEPDEQRSGWLHLRAVDGAMGWAGCPPDVQVASAAAPRLDAGVHASRHMGGSKPEAPPRERQAEATGDVPETAAEAAASKLEFDAGAQPEVVPRRHPLRPTSQ